MHACILTRVQLVALTACRWVQVQGGTGAGNTTDFAFEHDDGEEEFDEFGPEEDEDGDNELPTPAGSTSLAEAEQIRRETAELARLAQDLALLTAAEREARFREVEQMMERIVTGRGEPFTHISVPEDHWRNLAALEAAGEEICAVAGSFESLVSLLFGNLRKLNALGNPQSPVWEFLMNGVTRAVFERLVLLNGCPSAYDHDGGWAAWKRFSDADFERFARMQALLLKVRAVADKRGEFERPRVLGLRLQLLGVTRLGTFGAKARKHFNKHACFDAFERNVKACHLSLLTRIKHTPTAAQIANVGALIEFVGGPSGVAASIMARRGPGYLAVLAAHAAAVRLGVQVRAERLAAAQARVDAMDAATLAAKMAEVAARYTAFMATPILPRLKHFESVRSARRTAPLGRAASYSYGQLPIAAPSCGHRRSGAGRAGEAAVLGGPR